MNKDLIRVMFGKIKILFVLFCLVSLFANGQISIADSMQTLEDSVPGKDKINAKEMLNEMDMEIDGLLIDETRTKAGRDFYDLFYNTWESPVEEKNFIIRIIERPYRVNLTTIEVMVNDQSVINTILQPRQGIIEELVANVDITLKEYLINYNQIMEQLDSEDQNGSGIY